MRSALGEREIFYGETDAVAVVPAAFRPPAMAEKHRKARAEPPE